MPLERLLAVQRPTVHREPPVGSADDAHVGLLVLVLRGFAARQLKRARHGIVLHVSRIDLEIVRALFFERTRIVDVDLCTLLLVPLNAEPDGLASAGLVTVDSVGFTVKYGR